MNKQDLKDFVEEYAYNTKHRKYPLYNYPLKHRLIKRKKYRDKLQALIVKDYAKVHYYDFWYHYTLQRQGINGLTIKS